MIINLSSKLVLPLIDRGYVNLYYDSGTTVTPQSNYSGYKTVYVEGIRGSHEAAEFGTSDYTVTPSGGADMIKSATVKGIKAQILYGSLSEKEQVFTPTSPNVGFSSMRFYSPTNRSVIYAKPLPNDFTYTPTYADDYGIGTLNLSAALLQEKTEEPKEEAFQVKPDSGYYGLSKVTIKGKTGYKAYERTYTGNDNNIYTASNVPDSEYIKNPIQIIIAAINTIPTIFYWRVLTSASVCADYGYTIHSYRNDSGRTTQMAQTYLSAYNYKTNSSNGFSLTVPDFSDSTVAFHSRVQYFIGIYGT